MTLASPPIAQHRLLQQPVDQHRDGRPAKAVVSPLSQAWQPRQKRAQSHRQPFAGMEPPPLLPSSSRRLPCLPRQCMVQAAQPVSPPPPSSGRRPMSAVPLPRHPFFSLAHKPGSLGADEVVVSKFGEERGEQGLVRHEELLPALLEQAIKGHACDGADGAALHCLSWEGVPVCLPQPTELKRRAAICSALHPRVRSGHPGVPMPRPSCSGPPRPHRAPRPAPAGRWPGA